MVLLFAAAACRPHGRPGSPRSPLAERVLPPEAGETAEIGVVGMDGGARSIAIAATWASVTSEAWIAPAEAKASRRSRCRGPGWRASTDGQASHDRTCARARVAGSGRIIAVRVVIRRTNPSATTHGMPTGSPPARDRRRSSASRSGRGSGHSRPPSQRSMIESIAPSSRIWRIAAFKGSRSGLPGRSAIPASKLSNTGPTSR